MERPADAAAIEEALNRLRTSLPKPERSLFPRFVVRIVDGEEIRSRHPYVSVKAATLLQAKTQEEAAVRLAAALGRQEPLQRDGAAS